MSDLLTIFSNEILKPSNYLLSVIAIGVFKIWRDQVAIKIDLGKLCQWKQDHEKEIENKKEN